MKTTLSINVWPARNFDAEFMVYELEVETPWWQLTQRVHSHDLAAAIKQAVDAVVANQLPKP